MRIKVDNINNVVIASGFYKNKRIIATAVCSKNDEFNEEFGIELAKKKYKIKERYERMRYHEKRISELKAIAKKINNMIADHDTCANAIDGVLQEQINECENFVNSYFNK